MFLAADLHQKLAHCLFGALQLSVLRRREKSRPYRAHVSEVSDNLTPHLVKLRLGLVFRRVDEPSRLHH